MRRLFSFHYTVSLFTSSKVHIYILYKLLQLGTVEWSSLNTLARGAKKNGSDTTSSVSLGQWERQRFPSGLAGREHAEEDLEIYNQMVLAARPWKCPAVGQAVPLAGDCSGKKGRTDDLHLFHFYNSW